MVLRNAFDGLATSSDQTTIRSLLRAILDRLGYVDPTQGAMRVSVTNGTVTTVTTLSNAAAVGGRSADNDQQVQFYMAAQQIRNRITVTP